MRASWQPFAGTLYVKENPARQEVFFNKKAARGFSRGRFAYFSRGQKVQDGPPSGTLAGA